MCIKKFTKLKTRENKSSRKIQKDPTRENKSTRNVKKIHSRKYIHAKISLLRVLLTEIHYKTTVNSRDIESST